MKKRLGKAPQSVINIFIADILPQDIKPTTVNIDNYKLKNEDIKELSKIIVETLNSAL